MDNESREVVPSTSILPVKFSSHLTILDGSFFQIINIERSRTSESHLVTAQCMRCLPNYVEVKGSLNTSSNYITHLKRKHDPSVLKEYEVHATKKRAQSLAERAFWRRTEKLNFGSMGWSLQHVQQQHQLDDDVSPTKVTSSLAILDGTFFRISRTEQSPSSESILVTAQCMKCLPSVTEVKGSLNSSSNYVSHLRRKHDPSVLKEYEEYAAGKRGRGTGEQSLCQWPTKKNTSQKTGAVEQIQQQFEDDVARFFISSMIPLRFVEDQHFKNIFVHMWNSIGNNQLPVMKLINQHDLSKHIENMHQEIITTLKMCIEYTDHLCTTVDKWTCRNITFIGITVHWICYNTLQRKSALLAFKRFRDAPSAKNCSDFLCNVHKELSLDSNKVMATITHNIKLFTKDFQSFGIAMPNFCKNYSRGNDFEEQDAIGDNESSNDGLQDLLTLGAGTSDVFPQHSLQCFTHTLTLCLTRDGLKSIAEDTKLKSIHFSAIQKCALLWNLASHYDKNIKELLGCSLNQPVETSWNSLSDSLKQIIGIHNRYADVCKTLDVKTRLDGTDFTYLKEYVSCVAPVTEALDILQNDKCAYFGLLLPCLVALRRKLQALQMHSWVYCKPLAVSLLCAVERRFTEFFNISSDIAENAAMAALSYPRFKDSWLCCFDEQCRNKLISEFRQILAARYSEDEPEWLDLNQSSPYSSQEHDNFFDFGKPSSSSKNSHLPLHQELELQHYFGDSSQDVSMLEKYPSVRKVFIQYNTLLPSSAPVEGLFSTDMMENASNTISEDMFEIRVFLKGNLIHHSTEH